MSTPQGGLHEVQGPDRLPFRRTRSIKENRTRSTHEDNRTGIPSTQGYTQPRVRAQKTANPFSGIGLAKQPTTTTAHPNRLNTTTVVSRRTGDRTRGDLYQKSRLNAVGTNKTNSDTTKSWTSTNCNMSRISVMPFAYLICADAALSRHSSSFSFCLIHFFCFPVVMTGDCTMFTTTAPLQTISYVPPRFA